MSGTRRKMIALPVVLAAVLVSLCAAPAGASQDLGALSQYVQADNTELLLGDSMDLDSWDVTLAKVSDASGALVGAGRVDVVPSLGRERPIDGKLVGTTLWGLVELDDGFALITVDAVGFFRTGPCGDGVRTFDFDGDVEATAFTVYAGFAYVAYSVDGDAYMLRVSLVTCLIDASWGGPMGVDVDVPGTWMNERVQAIHAYGSGGIAIGGEVDFDLFFIGLLTLAGAPVTDFNTTGYRVDDVNAGDRDAVFDLKVLGDRVYGVGPSDNFLKTFRVCFDLLTGAFDCAVFETDLAPMATESFDDIRKLADGRLLVVGTAGTQALAAIFDADFAGDDDCGPGGVQIFAWSITNYATDGEAVDGVAYLTGGGLNNGNGFDFFKFAISLATCDVLVNPFGGGLLIDFASVGPLGFAPVPANGAPQAPPAAGPGAVTIADLAFQAALFRAFLGRGGPVLAGALIRQRLRCPAPPAGQAPAAFACFFAIQYRARLPVLEARVAGGRPRGRTIVLARRNITLRAGQTRSVRTRLTRSARRTLAGYRRKRLRATLRLTVRRGSRRATGANRKTLSGPVTIRIDRRPRSRR